MKPSFAENSKALALVLLVAAPLSHLLLLSISIEVSIFWVVLFCALSAALLDALFYSRRTALVGCSVLAAGAAFTWWLIDSEGRQAFGDFTAWAYVFLSSWIEHPPVYGMLLAVILCLLITLVIWLFGKKVFFFPAVFAFCVALILLEWFIGVFRILVPAMATCGALVLLWAKALQRSAAKKQATVRENDVALYLLPFVAVLVGLTLLIVPADSSQWRSQQVYRTFERINNYLANYTGFSRPRNSFSIGGSGYMPLGTRLGGAVTLSDDETLRVRTNMPILLRGTIYNDYTGTSWTDNQSSRRYRYDSNDAIRTDTFDLNRPDVDEPMASQFKKFLQPIELSITPLVNSSSTMFTPYRGVTAVRANGFLTVFPYFNTEGEVFHTNDLRAGDGYTVVADYLNYQSSDFPLLMNDLLRMGLQDDPNRIKDIHAAYLRLPDNIEQGVYDLTKSTTEGLESAYDKACAIRDLLRQFNYTLSPPEPPANRDFVSFFLNHSHEGYCTYFATAMAVMARIENIPSRYVEGYMMTESAKNGSDYVLKGKNAHAWAELYFEGIGWIPFDATPSGAAPADSSGIGTGSSGYDPEPTMPIPSRAPSTSVPIPTKEEGLTLERLLGYLWVVPVGALALFGLWVLFAAMKARVTMSLSYAHRRFADNRRRTAYFYAAILRLLTYYNYPIKRGETLYTYSGRIGRWLRLGPGSFERVADLMVRISYSGYEPSDDDVKFMADFRDALAHYTYETVGMWYYLFHQILGFKGKIKGSVAETPKTHYYTKQKS